MGATKRLQEDMNQERDEIFDLNIRTNDEQENLKQLKQLVLEILIRI